MGRTDVARDCGVRYRLPVIAPSVDHAASADVLAEDRAGFLAPNALRDGDPARLERPDPRLRFRALVEPESPRRPLCSRRT